MRTTETLILGAGVVGLTTAFRLAGAGRRVVVLDRGDLGREASWAGGGILTPINPHRYPGALVELCNRSMQLYPGLAEEVEAESGLSVELRSTGLLRLSFEDDDRELEEVAATHERAGRKVELVTGARARELEHGLAADVSRALHEPDIGQVRNPRLLKALVAGCARRGVELLPHCAAERLVLEHQRVVGVRTSQGEVRAEETVVAAGAWSRGLLTDIVDIPVIPVHGVMVLVESQPALVRSMIIGRGRYLIPRADGRIIIGSTMEHRGFDKTVRIGSVQELLAAAISLVPGIGRCGWQTAWAGLRPGSPDRLPYLGRPPGVEGLIVACGHYRNGLTLAPVTAELVHALVAGAAPPTDLTPFAVDRARSG